MKKRNMMLLRSPRPEMKVVRGISIDIDLFIA